MEMGLMRETVAVELNQLQLVNLLRYQRLLGLDDPADALLSLVDQLDMPEKAKPATKTQSATPKKSKTKTRSQVKKKPRQAPLDAFLPDGTDPFQPVNLVGSEEDIRSLRGLSLPDFDTIRKRSCDESRSQYLR